MIQDPKAWPSFSTELGEGALVQWRKLVPMDMDAKYIPRHTTMNMVGYGWMDQKMNYSLRLKNKKNRMSSLYSELEALIWAIDTMLQYTNS